MFGELDSSKLSDQGKARATEISKAFDHVLRTMGDNCPNGDEVKLARQHIEIACYFAKKAVTQLPQNLLE
jgi:hypothetical protein